MSDQSRVLSLLRSGHSRSDIAAMLNATLAQVRDVIVGTGSLPANGGGLVVGAFELIDYGSFPVDPTALDIAAVPVPSEIWLQYVRPADLLAGFQLMEPVGGETFAANYDVTPHDAVVSIRSIIPPDTAVQFFPSGDTPAISIDLLRRRLLG